MSMMSRLFRRFVGYAARQIPSINDIFKYSRFMSPYVRRYWAHYTGQFVVMLFGVFYTLFYAGFLKAVTEAAIHQQIPHVERLLAFGLAMFLTNSGMAFFSGYLYTSANVRIRKDLTEDLFRRILHMPFPSMMKFQSGDLVSRLKNDVDTAVGAVGSNLINLIRLPLTACAAFVYLWHLNAGLALTCLAFGPFALIAAVAFRPALRKNGRNIQSQYGKLFAFISESLTGYPVIRAFVLERLFLQRYQKQNETWVGYELKGARLRGYFRIGTQAVSSMAFLTSLGFGALYVAQGKLSVGSLMAYVSLLQHLLSPFTGVTRQLGGLQRALAASERIWTIYEEPTEGVAREATNDRNLIAMPVQSEARRDERISLRIDNLSFSYDGEHAVLSNINLDVPAGKVIAIVGPSGAGKSTLFNITLGFYRPAAGCVWLNDISTSMMDAAKLRSRMAYVPQDTYVFSGTIRDNILYGRPEATESELILAAQDANIHDFILSLPDGYNTEIGERGVRLSGGQRQRLAIARAILKDAPILLLDEATSALDTETEYLVQEALQRLMRNRTTMVIAHRLSTIHHADIIAVMEHGSIVEMGSHSDLIHRNGLYSRLYKMQFKNDTSMAVIG